METTTSYHLATVKVAVINKSTNKKFGEEVKKKEPLCIVDGITIWCSHYGKQNGSSSKN